MNTHQTNPRSSDIQSLQAALGQNDIQSYDSSRLGFRKPHGVPGVHGRKNFQQQNEGNFPKDCAKIFRGYKTRPF